MNRENEVIYIDKVPTGLTAAVFFFTSHNKQQIAQSCVNNHFNCSQIGVET